MPRKQIDHRALIGKRWVHLFEEDTSKGEVYRPETVDIPLSRRPREAFELDENGTARLFVPGPDDRLTAVTGTWRDEGGVIVLRASPGRGRRPMELRIVEAAPDRLLVRR